MPPILYTLGILAIRLIGAVLGWVLVTWLVPLFFNYIHIPIPDLLVNLLALLVALCILFSDWWWTRLNRPPVV